MYHQYKVMIAIIMVLVLSTPYSSMGFLWNMQPFIVRADLAPSKIVQKSVKPPVFALEKYMPDNKDRSITIKAADEEKVRSWSEFQYGHFRLRISRYDDLRLKSDTVRSNNTDGIWEVVKSLPDHLGNSSNRETLETMGKTFTPKLELGIEF